ncbi:MAG TPA: site-specific DNA-methyltransferase [Edaphocola sp.]|nr:site-specific DNA-methyltransferase [Edaphocola sp.]
MNNIYEQRFFSALKDTFIGHPIKGKSGYVNLMDIKAQYFAEIEPYIKDEINKQIEVKYREELFEKLYHFFDCYLNETGTVFFANSQIHKNLYEKVYSDRDDVSLFWKTQKLYYVKSEANYEDLQSEINGIKILFDASEIKHTKGNEKKAIHFYMVEASKKEVIFKVRYQENNQYDRLREYLEIDKSNDLIDKCIKEYGVALHPSLVFEDTGIDRAVIDRKTDSRKCLLIENVNDIINTVKVEYSINDVSLMLQYLHKKGVILVEEDLKKIFSIYKRQNEIDYFIHKDAEGFLKEQLDIYVYNWLFNDLETDFDAPTVKRMQNIKKIAQKVIEYIARFEDELKAIWEKPKFVRNCNYVLTLDKLADNIELIKKLIASPGWKKQVEEWKELNKEWLDDKEEVTKKEWKEFAFANDIDFEKKIVVENALNDKFQYLPIDTKFFSEFKNEILFLFNNYKENVDAYLMKSDNYLLLQDLQTKYKEEIQQVYIDPPFNTGSDFSYKDSYQDASWLSLMHDRLQLTKELMKNDGTFYIHLDENANFLGRILSDIVFGKSNFKREIIWDIQVLSGYKVKGAETNWILGHQSIYFYTKSNQYKFNKLTQPQSLKYLESFNKTDEQGREYQVAHGRNIYKDEVESKGKPYGDVWNNLRDLIDVERPFMDVWKELVPSVETEASFDSVWSDVMSFQQQPTSSERVLFDTQKPEKLLERIIKSGTDEGDIVLDFFGGSGSTLVTAIKLKRKAISVEQNEYINNTIIPRVKRTLLGHRTTVSIENKYTGGGLICYYELEQYEDVLAKAKYQWQGKEEKNQVEQYSFMQDQKLLDAIEIDYANKNAKVVFEKLYPDVDIAETLSNLSGKHIKQLFEDKVVFEDGTEIIYSEMTFEEYPWIKPLIWWNSK